MPHSLEKMLAQILAVIKIEEKNLSPIKFGYSDDLKIGDIIFAIGNPFGIGGDCNPRYYFCFK